jgi:formate hydrogenlyase subunit 3/multisubunit Na+/H+ antiporter MnhD subunit
VPSVSDPILLFLAVDALALLVLGIWAAFLPPATSRFLVTLTSGFGLVLSLPPLFLRAPAMVAAVPIGPPGLSLYVALDPLSAFFLAIVFLAGTAIAVFQATAIQSPGNAPVRITAFALAGTALTLLAADGVILAIGVAVTCGAIWLRRRNGRPPLALLSPLLLLTAVCLLAPPGLAPRFDAIRAAPIDPNHTTAAAALAIAAAGCLAWGRWSDERCWFRDALTAGVLIPSSSYLLLRLVVDRAGGATQTGCGFVLMLGGAAVAVVQAWCAASHPDIDGSVGGLLRRQAGLATAGVGLALIARAADLPGAASFALAATLLSAAGASVAGVLTTLAAQAMAASVGTVRLSRLGGLVHAMPVSSGALATGLLGLSALPPGLGFAGLWLLFEAIMGAPRTGGLPFQLPLALTGAAVAISAALATAASVRLVGIAVLGRPRTPLAAGAQEVKAPFRVILMVLAAGSLLAGILPGPVLWLLADPAIHALAGTPPGVSVGMALLSPAAASPDYPALPVAALLALGTGAARLLQRWSRKESKAAGFWAGGMKPPAGLPFGDPAAQSAGEGFLPALPDFPLPCHFPLPPDFRPLPDLPLPPDLRGDPRLRRAPRIPTLRSPCPPSATVALWLVLAAFGGLLLSLAVIG